MYKSFSLFAIHLKSDENTVPKSIFDLLRISSITKGRINNIRYITQVNVKPPTFAVFMSSPDDLPNSYRRFLLGSIVKTFDLHGVPIRIMFRKGNNPYIKNSS